MGRATRRVNGHVVASSAGTAARVVYAIARGGSVDVWA